MNDIIKSLEEDLKGWREATKSARYAIKHEGAHRKEFDLERNKRIEHALQHAISTLKGLDVTKVYAKLFDLVNIAEHLRGEERLEKIRKVAQTIAGRRCPRNF